MKISGYQKLANLTTLEDLIKFTSIDMDLLATILSGNLDLVANCNTALVSVSFAKANTTYPFTHGLARVPQGYFSAGMSANMVIFNGTTVNNLTQIFLQSSAVGSGKVLVF